MFYIFNQLKIISSELDDSVKKALHAYIIILNLIGI